jgi:hypothetical protein
MSKSSDEKAFVFKASVAWIRPEFGGRQTLPMAGLRPAIRFQKEIKDWFIEALDVQIVDLAIDEKTWFSHVTISMRAGVSPTHQHITDGALFELMDAYRVIAVGRIENVVQSL